MLNLLVTLSGAIFLCEDDFKNCIPDSFNEQAIYREVEITNDSYEGFSVFKDYLKYWEILTKNIKFTQKKYTDSNIFIMNKLVGWEKIQRLKNQTNRIGTEKTDEYFELDEDFWDR